MVLDSSEHHSILWKKRLPYSRIESEINSYVRDRGREGEKKEMGSLFWCTWSKKDGPASEEFRSSC